MSRWDTWSPDNNSLFDSFSEAHDRKDELKKTGFRVAIRKNADGKYAVYKMKLPEHEKSWREKNG